ncbi:TRAP transporter small permease [Hoeflea poritis]|uniref:TRAP transporter small permease protein n=1 Tax=Hoeflea poritis TaxID=2993659 RepID=A0ABT4VWM3_9HYPH|nr:TRAP transporter small permease [Hoeflea poritis]MDA4848408.1 TRAP transporter small permease [Hoeflea poritis]
MNEAPQEQGAVRTILKKALTTLETISCVVIFIMMVLTFIDVIGRYAFHKPIFGGTEIISALLALTIFSGLGVINARDDHITVELFEDQFRTMLSPVIYEIVIQLFSVVAMTLIALVLLEHAWEAYEIDKLTEVLEMPVYYVSGMIAVFAIISVLSQVTGVVLKILDLAAGRTRTQP